jgi:N-acetyl-anhydromuramyl-L-alanine amidase AmpD
MTELKFNIAHGSLKSNQYYQQEQKKDQICLHHTAGGSAQSSVDWWNSKPDHISTPYLIDRDGTIIETYPPKYWAYALGLTDGTATEKRTIHIELCNWGWLVKKGSKFYRAGNQLKEIPADQVISYKTEHRGFLHFERYTQEQIDALVFLIGKLMHDFGIKISNVEKFWHFGAKSKGLISHTTVRRDKSDIHPQPELIAAIYKLAGCTAPITE